MLSGPRPSSSWPDFCPAGIWLILMILSTTGLTNSELMRLLVCQVSRPDTALACTFLGQAEVAHTYTCLYRSMRSVECTESLSGIFWCFAILANHIFYLVALWLLWSTMHTSSLLFRPNKWYSKLMNIFAAILDLYPNFSSYASNIMKIDQNINI